MSYLANIYNVMLASPSDVNSEKEAAREIIYEWNNINSLTRKIVLLPVSWDYNAVPLMGDRPQEIINKQILKNADLLIGIFWTRIGTPTGKAVSGTVEEIEEHINSGKPAMLYFSNTPVVPTSINREQYEAVTKLKTEYESKGLTCSYNTFDEFKSKFRRHIGMILNNGEHFINYEEGDSYNDQISNSVSFYTKTLSEEAK
jgi:hypothetical protein